MPILNKKERIFKKRKIVTDRGLAVLNQINTPKHTLRFLDSDDDDMGNVYNSNEQDPLSFTPTPNSSENDRYTSNNDGIRIRQHDFNKSRGANQTLSSQLASPSHQVAPRKNQKIYQYALGYNEINNKLVQQENAINQPAQGDSEIDNELVQQENPINQPAQRDSEIDNELVQQENHINQPAQGDNAIDDLIQQENPINQLIPENYTLDNKFISKFIIDSIEYYKAAEGHGFEEKNARYKPNDNGEIYLGEGKSVKPDVWRMLQTEKPLIFLREIALKLWEPRDLANRALDIKRVTKMIPNRSPVKRIELNLLKLLISLFNDFLDRQKGYTAEEKAKFLKQSTQTLSQKIRDLKSEERGKKTKKRIRYD